MDDATGHALVRRIEELTRENERLRAERALWIEEWDLLRDQLEHLQPVSTEPADGL